MEWHYWTRCSQAVSQRSCCVPYQGKDGKPLGGSFCSLSIGQTVCHVPIRKRGQDVLLSPSWFLPVSHNNWLNTGVPRPSHCRHFEIMLHFGSRQGSVQVSFKTQDSNIYDLSVIIDWFKLVCLPKNILIIVEMPPVGEGLSLCFYRPYHPPPKPPSSGVLLLTLCKD